MKKWLKRAGRSAALVLMLGVMMLPREGAALPIRWHEPPQEIGDPDTPGAPLRAGTTQLSERVSIPLSFFLPTGRTLIVLITIKVPSNVKRTTR